MDKKWATFLVCLLLSLNFVLADGVNITADVVEHLPSSPKGLSYTMHLLGSGIGGLFSGIGAPLMLLLILISLGSAVGYIISTVLEGV